MKNLGLIAVVLLSATACAQNTNNAFPQAPSVTSENKSAMTGTLLVTLTAPMDTVTVTIDNVVVAENKDTRRVEVEHVPVGEIEVTVVVTDHKLNQPINDTRKITVKPNATTTIALATPSRSVGEWALGILGAAGLLYMFLFW